MSKALEVIKGYNVIIEWQDDSVKVSPEWWQGIIKELLWTVGGHIMINGGCYSKFKIQVLPILELRTPEKIAAEALLAKIEKYESQEIG